MKITENEQRRLAESVSSKHVICFYADHPDNEVPSVRWSVFGDPKTNTVVVRANKGALAYYHSAPSWLLYPPMKDRVFGIDEADETLAQKLGAELWQAVGVHLSNS